MPGTSVLLGADVSEGIDLIPVCDDEQADIALERIRQLRIELVSKWEREGWRTSLDVGTLHFKASEAMELIEASQEDFQKWLSWHSSLNYCLDKGYRGKAVYDPDSIAGSLIDRFHRFRFHPEIVAQRLRILKNRFYDNVLVLKGHITEDRFAQAAYCLNEGAEHLRTYLLESWGERDHSFARYGTRFERIALRLNKQAVAERLNGLNRLDDESVVRRMNGAPEWIKERHRLSWKCRKMIGEEVTEIQDARDVIRVFSRYELRRWFHHADDAFPEWLSVSTSREELQARTKELERMGIEIMGETP